ncbi:MULTISPECIES: acetolactate decarboxylase [unclassified Francisella]|uniref:acetolactate decarboxylase n=1 Tax=unclassified Francisella TaxID=2610885 RepID=UPI002E30307D|nr:MULTISPECIES: acetolactate decarboxylase [unclassified Francisella]MED7820172.1 acetolactate decarboxylase [Francisella sp. 19S2-4]MED7830992.1 acetolactate decarboxylase [Francisella sp. 19S2-10]
MRKIILLIITLLITSSYLFASNTIYQAGTITSLTSGIYSSNTSLKDLESKGQYGLGTIAGAKGEMIIFKDKAYLSDISGKAVPLNENITVPFADVFSFSKPQINSSYNNLTIPEITSIIKHKLYGDNYFYIIKISGKFSKIHARTIPPAKKGYTLSEWIAKNQKFHDLENVDGTLIGIYSPKYLASIAVPGFHFHFITKDHSHVYHVYSFESAQVNIQIEKINNFQFILPDTKEYQKATIDNFSHETISKMEEGK